MMKLMQSLQAARVLNLRERVGNGKFGLFLVSEPRVSRSLIEAAAK